MTKSDVVATVIWPVEPPQEQAPCALPEGPVRRRWAYGVLHGLPGNLKQASRAKPQVYEGFGREEQSEPLSLVRLDLDLVDFLVDGQHCRPHGPLGRITQLDLSRHQSPDAQEDRRAMLLLVRAERGGVAEALRRPTGWVFGGSTHGQINWHQTHDETYGDDPRETT